MVKYDSQDHFFQTSPSQEEVKYLAYKAASHAKAGFQPMLNFIQDTILGRSRNYVIFSGEKGEQEQLEIIVWSYFYPGRPNIVPIPFQLDEDN